MDQRIGLGLLQRLWACSGVSARFSAVSLRSGISVNLTSWATLTGILPSITAVARAMSRCERTGSRSGEPAAVA